MCQSGEDLSVKKSTEICPLSSIATSEPGSTVLVEPSHWGGVPINIYPLPHCEERGPSHVDKPMLFLVLSGHCQRRYRYNANTINLETKPGGIELLSRDYQREWGRWDGGAPGFTVGIHFVPQVVNRLVKGVSDFDIASTHEFFDPKIQWLVHELLAEAHRGAPEGPLYAESLSCALIAYLGRTHGNRRYYDQPAGALSPINRQRIIDYIEENLGEEISVTAMAEEVGLSPHHFSRGFTASFGLPPHRYVLHRRIEAAWRMLKLTSLPIVDVALNLGFSSHGHFSEVFRKHTGMTPTHARSNRFSPPKTDAGFT